MSQEEDSVCSSSESSSYCVCGEGAYGTMVECSDKNCRICWFHLECVHLDEVPRGCWRCDDCASRVARASRQRKASLGYSFASPPKTAKKKATPRTKKKKKQQQQKQKTPSPKKRKTTTPTSLATMEDLIEDGDDDDELPPLTVASAERQSRGEIEVLLREATPSSFFEDGTVENDDACEGLCKLTVKEDVFAEMKKFHDTIKDKLRNRLTAWAGVSEGDGRARGYAFLPPSFGLFGEARLKKQGVQFHAATKTGEDADDDEAANWRSCVDLAEEDVSPKVRGALAHIVNEVRRIVPRKYRPAIRLDQLHALQPNLHNGLDHLPPHVDHGLNDGFGVVIVTLCVNKDAHILILPHEEAGLAGGAYSRAKKKARTFECNEGDLYILAGNARNACDHGVICPLPSTRSKKTTPEVRRGRESLNLRFGLHSLDPQSPFYIRGEMPHLFDDDDDGDDQEQDSSHSGQQDDHDGQQDRADDDQDLGEGT